MGRNGLLISIACMAVFTSCIKQEFDQKVQEQIKANVAAVFGTQFDANHDWCTTTRSAVTIYANTTSHNVVKAQVLISDEQDGNIAIRVLNEGRITNGEHITLAFDSPVNYSNLLVAFVSEDGGYYYSPFALGDEEVFFDTTTRTVTRALSENYVLPAATPVVSSTVATFANERGWLPGEVFYTFDNARIAGTDYSNDFKTVFRTIIFNYFPNGRKYNNLPQIKKSGYYNESVYPLTTGTEPIILSPIYKNDGGYHEISEAELYYYYFKGDLTVEQIEALPKYRAIDLSTVYTNDNNNNVAKGPAFALAYFGDGIPAVGTTGTYQFPQGYKIGFAYKSNTTTDNRRKQGEVYGDGRLNYNINSYGNFASSGLADTDPRMAWMTVNNHMFLCVESGTDKDFNDLIVEVEGGIEPIEIIPDEPEYNYYTFCFEDHNLGDYDLNDVVLKGRRVNETQVEYTLMACGAYDELYIYNIDGTTIRHDREVHDILGQPRGTYINTEKGKRVEYVVDNVTVSKDFSFLDATTQPYIVDTTIGNTVRLATVGQDPHAIMIPYDFKWPLEKVCIKDAYSMFNNWGASRTTSTDWYKHPDEEQTF